MGGGRSINIQSSADTKAKIHGLLLGNEMDGLHILEDQLLAEYNKMVIKHKGGAMYFEWWYGNDLVATLTHPMSPLLPGESLSLTLLDTTGQHFIKLDHG